MDDGSHSLEDDGVLSVCIPVPGVLVPALPMDAIARETGVGRWSLLEDAASTARPGQARDLWIYDEQRHVLDAARAAVVAWLRASYSRKRSQSTSPRKLRLLAHTPAPETNTLPGDVLAPLDCLVRARSSASACRGRHRSQSLASHHARHVHCCLSSFWIALDDRPPIYGPPPAAVPCSPSASSVSARSDSVDSLAAASDDNTPPHSLSGALLPSALGRHASFSPSSSSPPSSRCARPLFILVPLRGHYTASADKIANALRAASASLDPDDSLSEHDSLSAASNALRPASSHAKIRVLELTKHARSPVSSMPSTPVSLASPYSDYHSSSSAFSASSPLSGPPPLPPHPSLKSYKSLQGLTRSLTIGSTTGSDELSSPTSPLHLSEIPTKRWGIFDMRAARYVQCLGDALRAAYGQSTIHVVFSHSNNTSKSHDTSSVNTRRHAIQAALARAGFVPETAGPQAHIVIEAEDTARGGVLVRGRARLRPPENNTNSAHDISLCDYVLGHQDTTTPTPTPTTTTTTKKPAGRWEQLQQAMYNTTTNALYSNNNNNNNQHNNKNDSVKKYQLYDVHEWESREELSVQVAMQSRATMSQRGDQTWQVVLSINAGNKAMVLPDAAKQWIQDSTWEYSDDNYNNTWTGNPGHSRFAPRKSYGAATHSFAQPLAHSDKPDYTKRITIVEYRSRIEVVLDRRSTRVDVLLDVVDILADVLYQ